jgi:glycosyltransferase involved in cell wall biosynthesis
MPAQPPRTGHGIPTVVVFTTAFPFDRIGEVSFVRPELESLHRRFERVVVVPSIRGTVQCELPELEVAIDPSLAERIHPSSPGDRRRLAAEAVLSPWLVREVARCPRLLLFPSALKRFVFCAGAARRCGEWIEERFSSGAWDASATVLYTYWTNYITAGLSRARRGFPGLRIVSRAHGADIYEDRYRPPCFPLQRAAVEAADHVFAASEAGRDHLAARYPLHRDKISVAPLGTPEPGFLNRPSDDGCFRVVSCSSLESVKRVGLLVDSLAALGAHLPGRSFEWHHLGGGSEQAAVAEAARERLPGNIRWELLGPVPPEQVIAFYRDHPVDLFLSTTRSEGGRPVSMMEALSCGIPVASTSVGGVPELIAPDRGWLMPPNPTPREVAGILSSIVNLESIAATRAGARSYWEENLRAEVRADRFAGALRSLVPRHPRTPACNEAGGR